MRRTLDPLHGTKPDKELYGIKARRGNEIFRRAGPREMEHGI
jgi:hypothetical protein